MNIPDTQRLEEANFRSAREATYRHTDVLFAWLMVAQWISGVVTALWLSPVTWKGNVAAIHPHVWAAVFLGGVIASLPIFMAWKFAGKTLTRHTFAVAQMLYGALLIHLTGGRIETHFHIFGSLAFLAFYRDSRVLGTATLVVLGDHFLRGLFWPESVYGAVAAPLWRSFEHAAWVVFEDVFLIVAIRKSLDEMRRVARREAELEVLNAKVETKVEERTRLLIESEERFAQLADNSPDVFWFMDLNPARIRYVSPSVRSQWGVLPQQFYNDVKFWYACVPEEDQSIVLDAVAAADATQGASLECEHRVRLPDGTLRRIHFRGTLIRDAEGKAIRLGGLSRDITEQRKIEEKMRLDAQRLRLAAEASAVGIWEFDLVTGDLEWDDEAYRLYGMTRSEAPTGYSRWKGSVHPEDIANVETALRHTVKTGTPLDTEFRIHRRNDGAVRYLRTRATVIKNEEGVAVRVIGTNWDITAEHGREAALRDALEKQTQLTELARAGERAKQEFLAAMSHEIRTPLSGMLGFAEAALESRELPPDAMECLKTIKDGGEALMRIINDILDFSRIGAGRLQIEKAAFSPAELIDDVHTLFSHQAATKALSFDVVVDGKLPLVISGDAGRIRQILLNLVGNAMKFTAFGSVRIVANAVDASRIEFAVEDTGPGIPPDKLNSIFDPFTQADSSNARRYGGVGLGLAISSKLAQLMGGELSGRNLDTGARFSLLLPLEAATMSLPADEPMPSPVDHIDKPGGKILVAEDDKINLALLLRMVGSWGYEVVTATNGMEAVEVFCTQAPAFVIMDIQMPILDGIEATEQIREIERKHGLTPCYIVALTADIMPENRENCLRAGMNAYLNKPLKKTDLAALLRSKANDSPLHAGQGLLAGR